ncbi:MAG TPA: hypothetical protein VK010_03960 [Flavobacteriaceae bacterium]|nr:hypothetical protein [Flavobacteriaceae bacterium]
METAELKKKLIAKINLTDNNEILESVMNLLEFHNEENVYILNDAQLAAIEEAQEDFRNGRFLTNEDANAEIEKWLRK